MSGRFAGRVAIVTGAAAGIGAATAALLAAEGARVALLDVDEAGLGEAAQRLRAAGGEVLALHADVLSADAVEPAVQSVLAAWGRIDILVNNVGGSTVIPRPHRELTALDPEEWDQTLRFNLRGTFLCARAVIPHMQERRHGRIVNLSSLLARGDLRQTNAAYVTAKAGLAALTRRLALELAAQGITCNAVAPTVTLTERIRRLRDETEAPTLGGAVSPEGVARVIAFLASDDAALVSGQTIDVSGRG